MSYALLLLFPLLPLPLACSGLSIPIPAPTRSSTTENTCHGRCNESEYCDGGAELCLSCAYLCSKLPDACRQHCSKYRMKQLEKEIEKLHAENETLVNNTGQEFDPKEWTQFDYITTSLLGMSSLLNFVGLFYFFKVFINIKRRQYKLSSTSVKKIEDSTSLRDVELVQTARTCSNVQQPLLERGLVSVFTHLGSSTSVHNSTDSVCSSNVTGRSGRFGFIAQDSNPPFSCAGLDGAMGLE